jgi:hypothetical protein
MADHPSAPPLVDRERIRALIDAFRAGEDPDLSQICGALWELLYARIPRLTVSKEKSEQHRILESYLVELGLPASPDLQYIAGPVLWFAREKRLIPPAQANGRGPESWTLDTRLYEDVRKNLDEGRAAFGDWMTNALRGILAEQQ